MLGGVCIMFFSIALVVCTKDIGNWETVNKKGSLRSTKRQNQLTALDPAASFAGISAKPVAGQLNQLEG